MTKINLETGRGTKAIKTKWNELKTDYEEYEKQGQEVNNRTGKGTMKKLKYYD